MLDTSIKLKYTPGNISIFPHICVIFLTLIILNPPSSFSQTREMELDYFKMMYEKGNFSSTKYQDLAERWQEVIERIGGYPETPYNQERESVIYSDTIEVEGLPKQEIVNRLHEWGALTFENINRAINYKSLDRGRIIFNGQFAVIQLQDWKKLFGRQENITQQKGNFTTILNAENDRAVIYFTNINFDVTSYYYSNGTRTVETQNIPLPNLYPLAKFDPEEWKEALSILKNSNSQIKLLMEDAVSYVEEYETYFK